MYYPTTFDTIISTKIYTHGADVDGVSCAILAKLAFPNVDYELFANPEELNKRLEEDLKNDKLNKYNSIFITDLPVFKKNLERINTTWELRRKVVIIDHHIRTIDEGASNYDFCFVQEKLDERYTCATELFYRWLYMKSFIFDLSEMFDYVEHVRQNDTWEWRDKGEFGDFSHKLSYLLNEIGADEYIKNICYKLSNEPILKFSKSDEEIVKAHEEKVKEKLQEAMNSIVYFVDRDKNKVAVLFAPYFLRNEISDYIRKTHKPYEISYVIIVSLDVCKYGQKSYRRVDGVCDLNRITQKMNGGGHKNSARVLISKKQREKMDSFSNKRLALKYIVIQHYDEDNEGGKTMSEFMNYHCDMDDEGNFRNQEAIEYAIEKGWLKECGDGYRDVDGNFYYSDGTLKPY